MPVPDSKGSDITLRIEALSKRNDISPFEVKSLQREIDKLMAVSAAEAYMLGGMLAAIIGNRDESRSLHEKSLKLEYDVVGVFNYGVSMKKVGKLSLAKQEFAKAFEMAPGDTEIFEHSVQTMNFLLDYSQFESVVDFMRRARPDFDISDNPEVLIARSVIEHLESLDVSIGEFRAFGLHAEQALLKYDLSAIWVSERYSHFDGAPHIYVEFLVDSNSASVLYDVNEYLMDLVLGDECLKSWDKIILSVGRHEPEHERDGLEHSAA